MFDTARIWVPGRMRSLGPPDVDMAEISLILRCVPGKVSHPFGRMVESATLEITLDFVNASFQVD